MEEQELSGFNEFNQNLNMNINTSNHINMNHAGHGENI